MRSTLKIAAMIAATATSLAAQQPQPGPGGPPAAKMLLANSAELDLTDAQIVKLAGIARRAEARRRSMRASMDSARMRFGQPGQPGDSAARRQRFDRMRADMDKMRDQSQADQRDAIAVLTADQQAKAWDMVAGRGARRGGRMQMAPGGMGRRQQLRPEQEFRPRAGAGASKGRSGAGCSYSEHLPRRPFRRAETRTYLWRQQCQHPRSTSSRSASPQP